MLVLELLRADKCDLARLASHAPPNRAQPTARFVSLAVRYTKLDAPKCSAPRQSPRAPPAPHLLPS